MLMSYCIFISSYYNDMFLLCSRYMAPEYTIHGYLTDKADVYSFGIVALEIVSGRSNTMYRAKADAFYLLDWVTF